MAAPTLGTGTGEVTISLQGGGNSLSCAKPSNTVEDDILLAFVFADNPGPSGEVALAAGTGASWGSFISNNDGNPHSGLYAKVANGSEPATYDATVDPTPDDFIVMICRIQGGDISDIVNAVNKSSGDSENPSGATVTTDEDDCLVLSFIAQDTSRMGEGSSSSQTDILFGDTAPGGAVSGGGAQFVQASAGLTAAVAFTQVAAGAAAWTSITVALNPAPAGGGIKNMNVRVGGSWSTTATPHVRVGGAWQEVDAYVRVGGAWVQVHEKA